jgi:hypothetical protein
MDGDRAGDGPYVPPPPTWSGAMARRESALELGLPSTRARAHLLWMVIVDDRPRLWIEVLKLIDDELACKEVVPSVSGRKGAGDWVLKGVEREDGPRVTTRPVDELASCGMSLRSENGMLRAKASAEGLSS